MVTQTKGPAVRQGFFEKKKRPQQCGKGQNTGFALLKKGGTGDADDSSC